MRRTAQQKPHRHGNTSGCAENVRVKAGKGSEQAELLCSVNDSKKLSDKKRRELYPIIKEQAIAYGIAFADHKEIDEINILQATFLAMQRAIDQLSVKPDLALIDGNRKKDFGIPAKTVVKGDLEVL